MLCRTCTSKRQVVANQRLQKKESKKQVWPGKKQDHITRRKNKFLGHPSTSVQLRGTGCLQTPSLVASLVEAQPHSLGSLQTSHRSSNVHELYIPNVHMCLCVCARAGDCTLVNMQETGHSEQNVPVNSVLQADYWNTNGV